jgi:ornithine cyclodeaminase
MSSHPPFLDARAVAAALPWPRLIDALAAAFAAPDAAVPDRLHLGLPGSPPDPAQPVLLVMPALSPRLGIGTKLVSVFPGNAARGLPSIQGVYVLMDALDGRLLAVLDGGELTARRTAATSAVASARLSRPDSRRLLMVGTGRLAQHLPVAHAAVRPIERVQVWGRRPEQARTVAAALEAQGLPAEPVTGLERAVAEADLVSCATLSDRALLRGAWLSPGTHVDLVGAFKPHLRETDAEVFARATAVWCDTRFGALHEAGDIVQAIAEGGFAADRLAGDLATLCRGEPPPRGPGAITVFKSVGMALQDLVAARLCVDEVATPG